MTPGPSLTVLMLDDDPLALRLGRAIFERMGHKVVTLGNWNQLAPTLFGEKVDWLLVDIQMPGLTGDRLVEIVKQTGTGRRTPIVLISNLAEDEIRQRAQTAGADGWVQKPLTTEKAQRLQKQFFPDRPA